MNLIAKIQPWLGSHKIKCKMSHLWVVGIFLLMVMILWGLLGRFITGSDKRIEAALESGQRLELSLETGEIAGKTAKIEATETKAETTPIAAEKPTDEAKAPTDKTPPEDAKPTDSAAIDGSTAAWVNQDYIGPRLPDGTIKALLGDDFVKTKLKVDSVSIKDISEKPVVVIIIRGMGLSSSSTKEALELPKEITMGFSPYSPMLDGWVKNTRELGHEVVLNIPMETKDFHTDNPGPYSLLTQSSVEDNATRLKMLLSLTKEYSAIYSENTEIFTRSASAVQPVLELLQSEGKYFIYGGGYANYSMIQIADSINYPILVNDVVLDDEISANAINDRFVELEKIARDKGYVVVMARPYPITVRMLKAWLPTVAEKGLVVSPVSILLGKVIKK